MPELRIITTTGADTLSPWALASVLCPSRALHAVRRRGPVRTRWVLIELLRGIRSQRRCGKIPFEFPLRFRTKLAYSLLMEKLK
jgi:hypothetical protein